MSSTRKHDCCVRGCTPTKTRVAYFLFPSASTPRGQRWMEMFPHSFIRKPRVDNFICARHFLPEYFDSNGELLDRADPTVNIDISYAQVPMKKIFLMKILYEWLLRNKLHKNSKECTTELLSEQITSCKVFLGLPMFCVGPTFFAKFFKFKDQRFSRGILYGTNREANGILDIIKDIRLELPSNITIPADYMSALNDENNDELKSDVEDIEEIHLFSDENTIDLKSETDDVEEINSVPKKDLVQSSSKNQKLVKDVIPMESLETYQDALELLDPLKEFIERTKNESASLRLREIETVIKQAIRNDSKSKKRKRTST